MTRPSRASASYRSTKATKTPSSSADRSIDRYDRPRSPHSRSSRPSDPITDRLDLGHDDDHAASVSSKKQSQSISNGSLQSQKRPLDRDLARSHDTRDTRRFKVHYEADGDHADYNEHQPQSSNAENNPRRRGQFESNSYRRGARSDQDLQISSGGIRRESQSLKQRLPDISNEAPGQNAALLPDAILQSPQASAFEAPRDDALHESQQEAPAQPIDEQVLIEQRRQRREALRAKHRSSEAPLLQQALQGTTATNSAIGNTQDPASANSVDPLTATTASVEQSPSTSQFGSPFSPVAMSVKDDMDLANPASAAAALHASHEGPSAADYDPSMDMQKSKDHVQDPVTTAVHVAKIDRSCMDTPVEMKPKEFDMFADDDDDETDMFSTNIDVKASKTEDGTQAVRIIEAKQLDKSMLDDWDDAQGHYRIVLGELLDTRYAVQSIVGKGISSTVVRAIDTADGHEVAIKIIINHDQMRKYGLTEMAWMRTLAEADPDDKRHILRLERHFDHKGHLCIVFESLSIDLREVLKKFGRDIGINIMAVRAYAQQMFLGLSLMAKCNLIHADLKPDNMLVNDQRNKLKIADFGSAMAVRDIQVTHELVSRYYRAPEIMIGMKGDPALDMWSIGCTLFELYTGKICFTGADENQMLKQIMEAKGKIPNRMLKKAEYWQDHFDADGTFMSREFDNVTQRYVVRKLNMSRSVPNREIRARLFASASGLSLDEVKELNGFADLLDKCLALDPSRRIRPHEALKHEFITRTRKIDKT